MQQREKKLLYLFGAVFAIGGGMMLWNRMFAPIDEREERIRALHTKIRDQETTEYEILNAAVEMKAWKDQSLPPDETDAQRLYQAWLTDLSQMCGFRSLKVTPNRRAARGTTYVAVEVLIEAEATLGETARFLHRFRQANLLHRVADLSLSSDENRGDPVLRVKLTAEGVAMAEAPSRTRLFPETTLAADLKPSADSIAVAAAPGFPTEAPFRIRIAEEYLVVKEIDGGKWTVVRGADDTQIAEHWKESTVELAMVNPRFKENTAEAERGRLLARNPFTIPTEYKPALQGLADKSIVRGEALKMTARVSGLDPAAPKLEFALKDAPAGMTIDADKGELNWKPADDVKAGDFEVTVTAGAAAADAAALSKTIKISLKDRNRPPDIKSIENQKVVIGQTLSVKASASDPDGDAVKFKLEAGAPEGVKINGDTGEITWSPTLAVAPGDYKLTVTATETRSDKPLKDAATFTCTVNEDTAVFVYFNGSITLDGVTKALFKNRLENQRHLVPEGEKATIGGMEVVVVEIDPRYVLLETEKSVWRVELGQNLSSMKKFDRPKTTATSTDNDKDD